MGREDEIRLIAYDIWEEEGCPDGRDCEHWLRAEAIWEQNQKPKEVPVRSDTDSGHTAISRSKTTASRKKSLK